MIPIIKSYTCKVSKKKKQCFSPYYYYSECIYLLYDDGFIIKC